MTNQREQQVHLSKVRPQACVYLTSVFNVLQLVASLMEEKLVKMKGKKGVKRCEEKDRPMMDTALMMVHTFIGINLYNFCDLITSQIKFSVIELLHPPVAGLVMELYQHILGLPV